MIRAVLFDIGGVVVHDHGLKEAARSVFHAIEPDRLWHDLNRAILPVCRGEASLLSCWQQLASSYGLQLPEADLARLWIDGFEQQIAVDPAVVAIIERLKPDYQVATLSNTFPEHARVLASMEVYAHFDPVILSHQIGMAKDDPAAFRTALAQLGREAHETVFIDDVERYTAVATSVGMRAIHYTPVTDLAAALVQAGVNLQ